MLNFLFQNINLFLFDIYLLGKSSFENGSSHFISNFMNFLFKWVTSSFLLFNPHFLNDFHFTSFF